MAVACVIAILYSICSRRVPPVRALAALILTSRAGPLTCRANRTKARMATTIDHPALAPLKAQFPEAKFYVAEFRDMVTLVVPREHLLQVCAFLRDDPNLRYDMLADVNSVDYLGYPNAKHRFAVNYGLTSVPHNNRLWLKVFLDPEHETGPD